MPFNSIEDLLLRLGGPPKQLGSPAFWECPIQEGVPLVIKLAENFLLWLAAFAFLIGIILSIYYFATSFGSDDKIKKGKSTLMYLFVGATVIMLSRFAMQGIANSLVKSNVPDIRDGIERTQGCVQQQRGILSAPESRGN